ncbi:MAG: hypothetical protein A2632_00355 [Candidatus Pacebacteria bacterium RIFCSPHIGHO2_01_FULL_46_16]|nr:MAG: hypothetical protein A2632_00355 [Candidatus Pacebacteria bacterium RIFCSPHIGHO2_01_FULL_46_16]OGJ21093.1 MAG: hypothetical protein A3J60_03745 [Candidatus Pacebacteria bacterium RIFCSPHIGHO2_02_FULL_46_9]OGJ38749.1 MAG: hypothetical protein A3A82_03420 [Candidatus Pacebacteria bacterium RIFCSPLOWO2_01_FULL_47_12]
MLDQQTHKQVLVQILKEIYGDMILRKTIGFKGGTAAMLFYDLPRMSVDLDFDLLVPESESEVFERLDKQLPQFGRVKDSYQKRHTLFFLLNYEVKQRNVKIEISRRSTLSKYEIKDYLGISMLVMAKDAMVANKLAALLTRESPAARDFFDTWFFLKQNWDINAEIVKERTDMHLAPAFAAALHKVEQLSDKFFMMGMGELLTPSQKDWVRNKGKEELIFQLKLRLELLK